MHGFQSVLHAMLVALVAIELVSSQKAPLTSGLTSRRPTLIPLSIRLVDFGVALDIIAVDEGTTATRCGAGVFSTEGGRKRHLFQERWRSRPEA